MSKKKRRNAPHRAKKQVTAKKKNFEMKLWMKITAVVVAVVLLSGLIYLMLPRTQYAYIEIEDYGTIKVELYDDVAPITVKNFVSLAKDGFYDGLTFHRIMEGFMMQGGCPEGNGKGGNTDANGKEINIKGEFKQNGVNNTLSHKRGVISMARNGDPYYDSASSQFFIVHEDSTFLDGKYAGFGMVVQGIEIVDRVCEDAEPTDDNGTIPKSKQPVITRVWIETKIG